MRTQGQSLFKKHRLVFSSLYGLPMTSRYGKGGCSGTPARRGPAPGSPAAPAARCAVLRAWSVPGRALPPSEGRHGGGKGGRESREGKRTKALPEVEGRQGWEDRERAAAIIFLSFYYPRVTRKEKKNRNQRAITHVRGGGISVPRQAPEFRLWVSPVSLDMPDGEINLSALGGGTGTHPRVSGAQYGLPRITGLKARSGGVGSPVTCGADFVFHAAPTSLAPSPFDNLQLFLFFPNILCFPSAS